MNGLCVRATGAEDSLRPWRLIGRFWAARVGLHYRALAVEDEATIVWFWVGRIPSMIGSLVASESAARRRRK